MQVFVPQVRILLFCFAPHHLLGPPLCFQRTAYRRGRDLHTRLFPEQHYYSIELPVGADLSSRYGTDDRLVRPTSQDRIVRHFLTSTWTGDAKWETWTGLAPICNGRTCAISLSPSMFVDRNVVLYCTIARTVETAVLVDPCADHIPRSLCR
jgi:hypothetical protein